MREYIIIKEYNGKLKVGDLSIENVRCIYEDDYYSNKTMRGTFFLYKDQLNIDILSEPIRKFTFSDINGRTLNGKIIGSSLQNEYNSHWLELKFILTDHTQWLVWSENKITDINLNYNIPYIGDLSRDLKHNWIKINGTTDSDWLLKFAKNSFKIFLNNQEFEFFEKVYLYKSQEPDSILTRELFIKVSLPYDNTKITELLNIYESKISEIMLIVSFIFNQWIRAYSYNAELLDVNGKLVETIKYKESDKLCGSDYLKNSSQQFQQYLNSENLSRITENYLTRNIGDKKNITTLINKYLTLKDTKIFEPKFSSGFFLLEAVSKFIVSHPVSNIEDMIKEAAQKANVEIEIFETSHKRKKDSNSKYEWEITEYRNFLSHFNYQDNYNGELMYKEYRKIAKLSRKLILWTICPELKDWCIPS